MVDYENPESFHPNGKYKLRPHMALPPSEPSVLLGQIWPSRRLGVKGRIYTVTKVSVSVGTTNQPKNTKSSRYQSTAIDTSQTSVDTSQRGREAVADDVPADVNKVSRGTLLEI